MAVKTVIIHNEGLYSPNSESDLMVQVGFGAHWGDGTGWDTEAATAWLATLFPSLAVLIDHAVDNAQAH